MFSPCTNNTLQTWDILKIAAGRKKLGNNGGALFSPQSIMLCWSNNVQNVAEQSAKVTKTMLAQNKANVHPIATCDTSSLVRYHANTRPTIHVTRYFSKPRGFQFFFLFQARKTLYINSSSLNHTSGLLSINQFSTNRESLTPSNEALPLRPLFQCCCSC